MVARIRSLLFTSHPYERNVLLFLAWVQGVFVTAAGCVTVWAIWTSGAPEWQRLVSLGIVLPVEIFLSLLIAADWIRHYGAAWMLGYSYNPRVMAVCEMEGANVPPSPDPLLQALWERHKHDVLYFRVLEADLPDIEWLGYNGVLTGGFFPALWEGDPASGTFGGE